MTKENISKSPEEVKSVLLLHELNEKIKEMKWGHRVCINKSEHKDLKKIKNKIDFIKKSIKFKKEESEISDHGWPHNAEVYITSELTKDKDGANNKCSQFLRRHAKSMNNDWVYHTETEDDLNTFNNKFDVKSPDFYMKKYPNDKEYIDTLGEDKIKECTEIAKDYAIRGYFNIKHNKDLSASKIMENKKKMIQKFKNYSGRQNYCSKLISNYANAIYYILYPMTTGEKSLRTKNQIEKYKKKRFTTDGIIILTDSEREKYELPLDLDLAKLHKSIFEDKLYLDCGNVEEVGWDDRTYCYDARSRHHMKGGISEINDSINNFKMRTDYRIKEEDDEDEYVASGKVNFFRHMQYKLKRYLDKDERQLNKWFRKTTIVVVVVILLLIILYFFYFKKK